MTVRRRRFRGAERWRCRSPDRTQVDRRRKLNPDRRQIHAYKTAPINLRLYLPAYYFVSLVCLRILLLIVVSVKVQFQANTGSVAKQFADHHANSPRNPIVGNGQSWPSPFRFGIPRTRSVGLSRLTPPNYFCLQPHP